MLKVCCARLERFFGAGGKARGSRRPLRVYEKQVWHRFNEKKVGAAPHTLLWLAGMGIGAYLEERTRALGRSVLAAADGVA